MKIGKYCSPFFSYTIHLPRVIIFKKNLLLLLRELHTTEKCCISLPLTGISETMVPSARSKLKQVHEILVPTLLELTQVQLKLTPENCQVCHLLANKILALKWKDVFSFKFLAYDECHLSVRLLWSKFVNMTEINSLQVSNCSKGTALALTKVFNYSV